MAACVRHSSHVTLRFSSSTSGSAAPIEAGVDRADVKLLCGWETDSVFERDLIRNEANLARAVAKRFNEKVAGKSEAPAPALAPLSSSATT